jgi:hypothetical protein
MEPVTVRVTIGGLTVDSATDPRTEVLELETRRSIGGPGDRCRLLLYAPPAATGGPLTGAAGAAAGAAAALGIGGPAGAGGGLSGRVRGVDVKQGDPVEVELRAGDIAEVVMTAEVQAFESSLETTTVIGATGMRRLAGARLAAVYQNQTTGQVVRDLAGQVGVQVGDVAPGASWPYLVVDESRSLLRHLAALARREGADLYFDARNRLTVTRFTKAGPDHTFRYGVDLLDLRLRRDRSALERVQVRGESPASSQGLPTWPWLVKDLAPLGGTAGQGSRSVGWRDGAVRTKDAADRLATAQLDAARDAATSGSALLLGNPRVQLGDAVQLTDAPWAELNGLFKVTSVRHRVGKRQGFLTVVGLSGQGGAGGGAAGALGAAAGQLAGGLGL